MLKEERQQNILRQLGREGKVLATELSQTLNVSEDTIRRDLNELDEAGLIRRVHGGALIRSLPVVSFAARQKQATVAKAEIAQAALQFIRDGQVIILDGGTTTLQLARQLPADLHVTIITNSPPVAVALAEHSRVEVYILGGKLYKDGLTAIGLDTIETLGHFRADLGILGICSLHPEIGISVPNLEEASTKRAMIANSNQVIALATADKLNTAAPYLVGTLNQLTYLITEEIVTEEELEPYRKCGIKTISAISSGK